MKQEITNGFPQGIKGMFWIRPIMLFVAGGWAMELPKNVTMKQVKEKLKATCNPTLRN